MLEELHVRDIALIKEAWIEPGAGLTVFTGETGAGKTVLLNALKLIVGERGDTTLIRHGADAARIEARFSDDLVASRQFSSTGRNRCVLGDELVTVGRLAEVLGPMVDLHGQHDHQALLRPATHAQLLDQWGGAPIGAALDAYRAAFTAYRTACERLEDLESHINRSVEEIEAGRIALADIEQVDPQPGEDDALTERLPALQHADELHEAIQTALAALRAESGALDRIGVARDALSSVTGFEGRLDAITATLSALAIDLDENSMTLRAIAESLPADKTTLEETLTRLGALDGLKRRLGPSLEQVIERRDRLRSLLALTENSDEELAEAQRQVAAAKHTLESAADALHTIRSQSAEALAAELSAAVASLDMADGSFAIACEPLAFEQFTLTGPDRIEILYRPAPNTTMRPLGKIASGGEISRVMLALRSVLGEAHDASILVFDEIDAGIGGATATLVGRRLAEVARSHQVLVVTHLAQVAVFADTHYVVAKQTVDEEVATTVSLVAGDDRDAEIARMLGGETGSVAVEHARELFENARG